MYCSISILFSESPSFIFFIISIIIVLFHIQQHNICSIWKLCLSFAGIRIWLSLHRNGKPYYFHLLRTCEEGGIYCYVEKTCKQYLLCQPWCWSATSNMWFWWWSRKCLLCWCEGMRHRSTELPENDYGSNNTTWPACLHDPPDRLQSIKMEADISR